MRFTTTRQLMLLTALLGFSLASFAYEPELGAPPKPIETLEYVDGSPVDLAALKGKPVLVYVGADWCEPCILRGRPTTLKVDKKYAPLGLQTIFVSMDDNKIRGQKIEESKASGIRIAMSKMSLCPPNSCFRGYRDLGAFGRIYGYPTAVVIDAEGIVRARMDRGQTIVTGLESAVAKVMQAYGGVSRN